MSKKDAIYVPALHLLLAMISLAGDSDGLQRMVVPPTVPTTTQRVAFAFSPLPASSSSHLLHPQPHLIKGLCVVPPAPIEVGTTNYPFIPAVVPSAQRRSPCPPLRSPSSMLKNYFLFSPTKTSPPALTFHPHPIFCLSLVYCLFLQENMHNERDEWWWGG